VVLYHQKVHNKAYFNFKYNKKTFLSDFDISTNKQVVPRQSFPEQLTTFSVDDDITRNDGISYLRMNRHVGLESMIIFLKATLVSTDFHSLLEFRYLRYGTVPTDPLLLKFLPF